MICALLDFENVNPNIQGTPLFQLPTFRCKMPTLPSDVSDMMGFEVLQSIIRFDRSWAVYQPGINLYLLDNAENAHNNTLTNELFLTHLDYVNWRYYPNGVNTNQAGINFLRSDPDMKSIKYYISKKQDYLYFKLETKTNQRSNGWSYIVERGKIIVRLTFDKKQNDYQPKRIML